MDGEIEDEYGGDSVGGKGITQCISDEKLEEVQLKALTLEKKYHYTQDGSAEFVDADIGDAGNTDDSTIYEQPDREAKKQVSEASGQDRASSKVEQHGSTTSCRRQSGRWLDTSMSPCWLLWAPASVLAKFRFVLA